MKDQFNLRCTKEVAYLLILLARYIKRTCDETNRRMFYDNCYPGNFFQQLTSVYTSEYI